MSGATEIRELRSAEEPPVWSLLDGLSARGRDEILSAAIPREWGKGDLLFRAGDFGRGLHLIERGHFAAQISLGGGARQILSIMKPGECFGEVALLCEPAHRSTELAALEPGRTLIVLDSDLARARAEHPMLERNLQALLARRTCRLTEQLYEAHHCSAADRVLRRVADLCAIYACEGDMTVIVPLTQETVADLAGTSRQVVSETLGAEAQRGSIRLERGRITVVDLLRFRRMLLVAGAGRAAP